MAGLEKIESTLIDLGLSYEEIAANTWLVGDSSSGAPPIVVSLADPIVVVRANVMKVPKSRREELFRELLVLNAEGLAHGAYAIEGDDIVVVDSLVHASMDKNELEASIEAISFALTQHWPLISRFAEDK